MMKKRREVIKSLTLPYLREELSKHQNILSKYMYEYLEYILHSEISILKEGYIPPSDLQVLMQLSLVQDLAKYNIYERANRIFRENPCQEGNIIISSDDDKKTLFRVMGKTDNEQFPIFDYHTTDSYLSIELFNMIDAPIERLKEIERMNKRIESLYDRQNNSNTAIRDFQSKIISLQKIRHELMDREELDSKSARMQSLYNDLLLADYGFDRPTTLPIEKKSKDMQVSLTKKYPYVNLTSHITYH